MERIEFLKKKVILSQTNLKNMKNNGKSLGHSQAC